MSILRVDLQRVQTWLFASPKMRAMVGANVLLGEVLRERLPALISRSTGIDLSAHLGDYTPPSDDPLRDDDLRADLTHGILARDGGHFEVCLRGDVGALATRVEGLLRRELPGLGFELRIDGERREFGSAQSPFDLPQWQVCQEMGNGPASHTFFEDGELRYRSTLAQRRRDAGDRFYHKRTGDVLGRLRRAAPLFGTAAFRDPADLEDLVGTNYLAVVHADGNGVGRRAKQYAAHFAEGAPREVARQRFFHTMRGVVRAALVEALQSVFGARAKPGETRPFQLLMLGGDDLLLVLRAPDALPFVVAYGKALAKSSRRLVDGQPLSVGAGVLVAPHTVPFHHLHGVAEALAASAKRMHRTLDDDVSVVDWAVLTNAWSDDPVDVRRQQTRVWHRTGAGVEALALSAKPYRVLGRAGRCLDGLDEIVTVGASLYGPGGVARSQARSLAGRLREGRVISQLLVDELLPETRSYLEGVLGGELWRARSTGAVTPFADLVEVAEIDRLQGRASADAPHDPQEERP